MSWRTSEHVNTWLGENNMELYGIYFELCSVNLETCILFRYENTVDKEWRKFKEYKKYIKEFEYMV